MYFKYDIFRAELWYCPVDETLKNVAKSGAVRRKRSECGFKVLYSAYKTFFSLPRQTEKKALHPEL